MMMLLRPVPTFEDYFLLGKESFLMCDSLCIVGIGYIVFNGRNQTRRNKTTTKVKAKKDKMLKKRKIGFEGCVQVGCVLHGSFHIGEAIPSYPLSRRRRTNGIIGVPTPPPSL